MQKYFNIGWAACAAVLVLALAPLAQRVAAQRERSKPSLLVQECSQDIVECRDGATVRLVGKVLIDSKLRGGVLVYSRVLAVRPECAPAKVIVMRFRSSDSEIDDMVGATVSVLGNVARVERSNAALYWHILRICHDAGVIPPRSKPDRLGYVESATITVK